MKRRLARVLRRTADRLEGRPRVRWNYQLPPGAPRRPYTLTSTGPSTVTFLNNRWADGTPFGPQST